MTLPEQTLLHAVALGYQPGAPAPKVLAQGKGAIAQAILEKAEELGIPAKTDPALVAFLMELDLYSWVPPALYAAVAEVLAWAYETSGGSSALSERGDQVQVKPEG